ncbi:hypothetical protein CC1G_04947 [Coprinopsis cinerea okayama7|uniref:Transmembrane protein n=1 Tax=Coprinopsis cinerea (strain Okayama-7 / 130 / ATCC MYA-4618 / FGSC 9003) TaxID=240176 RepID=A8PFN3_COPC7|nr:hypothetical protein CC1G_04947 [Coprinopsis cinerea okayama7\|eukprot:XP_001841103.2 hypothetical protein CC1G_04947 [Coprinopsis cinerea okayama7\
MTTDLHSIWTGLHLTLLIEITLCLVQADYLPFLVLFFNFHLVYYRTAAVTVAFWFFWKRWIWVWMVDVDLGLAGRVRRRRSLGLGEGLGEGEEVKRGEELMVAYTPEDQDTHTPTPTIATHTHTPTTATAMATPPEHQHQHESSIHESNGYDTDYNSYQHSHHHHRHPTRQRQQTLDLPYIDIPYVDTYDSTSSTGLFDGDANHTSDTPLLSPVNGLDSPAFLSFSLPEDGVEPLPAPELESPAPELEPPPLPPESSPSPRPESSPLPRPEEEREAEAAPQPESPLALLSPLSPEWTTTTDSFIDVTGMLSSGWVSWGPWGYRSSAARTDDHVSSSNQGYKPNQEYEPYQGYGPSLRDMRDSAQDQAHVPRQGFGCDGQGDHGGDGDEHAFHPSSHSHLSSSSSSSFLSSSRWSSTSSSSHSTSSHPHPSMSTTSERGQRSRPTLSLLDIPQSSCSSTSTSAPSSLWSADISEAGGVIDIESDFSGVEGGGSIDESPLAEHCSPPAEHDSPRAEHTPSPSDSSLVERTPELEGGGGGQGEGGGQGGTAGVLISPPESNGPPETPASVWFRPLELEGDDEDGGVEEGGGGLRFGEGGGLGFDVAGAQLELFVEEGKLTFDFGNIVTAIDDTRTQKTSTSNHQAYEAYFSSWRPRSPSISSLMLPELSDDEEMVGGEQDFEEHTGYEFGFGFGKGGGGVLHESPSPFRRCWDIGVEDGELLGAQVDEGVDGDGDGGEFSTNGCSPRSGLLLVLDESEEQQGRMRRSPSPDSSFTCFASSSSSYPSWWSPPALDLDLLELNLSHVLSHSELDDQERDKPKLSWYYQLDEQEQEEVKRLVEMRRRAVNAERNARVREGEALGWLEGVVVPSRVDPSMASGDQALASASGSQASASPNQRVASSSSSSSTEFQQPAFSSPSSSGGELQASSSSSSSSSSSAGGDLHIKQPSILELQRIAADARRVAKRERARVKEVSALLRLKLGGRVALGSGVGVVGAIVGGAEGRDGGGGCATPTTSGFSTSGCSGGFSTPAGNGLFSTPTASGSTTPTPTSTSTRTMRNSPSPPSPQPISDFDWTSPPVFRRKDKKNGKEEGREKDKYREGRRGREGVHRLVAGMIFRRREAGSSSTSGGYSSSSSPSPVAGPSTTTLTPSTGATPPITSSAPNLGFSPSVGSSGKLSRPLWWTPEDREVYLPYVQRYKFLRRSPLARSWFSAPVSLEDGGSAGMGTGVTVIGSGMTGAGVGSSGNGTGATGAGRRNTFDSSALSRIGKERVEREEGGLRAKSVDWGVGGRGRGQGGGLDGLDGLVELVELDGLVELSVLGDGSADDGMDGITSSADGFTDPADVNADASLSVAWATSPLPLFDGADPTPDTTSAATVYEGGAPTARDEGIATTHNEGTPTAHNEARPKTRRKDDRDLIQPPSKPGSNKETRSNSLDSNATLVCEEDEGDEGWDLDGETDFEDDEEDWEEDENPDSENKSNPPSSKPRLTRRQERIFKAVEERWISGGGKREELERFRRSYERACVGGYGGGGEGEGRRGLGEDEGGGRMGWVESSVERRRRKIMAKEADAELGEGGVGEGEFGMGRVDEEGVELERGGGGGGELGELDLDEDEDEEGMGFEALKTPLRFGVLELGASEGVV